MSKRSAPQPRGAVVRRVADHNRRQSPSLRWSDGSYSPKAVGEICSNAGCLNVRFYAQRLLNPNAIGEIHPAAPKDLLLIALSHADTSDLRCCDLASFRQENRTVLSNLGRPIHHARVHSERQQCQIAEKYR